MKRFLEIALLCGVVLLALTRAQTAFAASIVVDTTAQEVPFVTNGNCTLGEAMFAARSHTAVDACAAGTGTDTITLPAGIFLLNDWGYPGESGLALPKVNSNLTIIGAGADQTILQAQPPPFGSLRLLRVSQGAQLTLEGVTLRDGYVSSDGGAIYNEGTLTAQNSRMIHNTAQSGGALYSSGVATLTNVNLFDNRGNDSGGAIGNYGTQLTIQNSAIYSNTTFAGVGGALFHQSGFAALDNVAVYDNRAHLGAGIANAAAMQIDLSQIHANAPDSFNTSVGGGIVNSGAMTITRSTIAGNRAQFTGGIHNSGSAAELILRESIVKNNTADEGAGLANGHDARAELKNVTLSGNSATFDTGGILNAATLTATNVTLANNSAPHNGAIYQMGGTTRLRNAIVADNPSDKNCDGAIISDGYNLDSGNSCGFSNTGDLVNTDPRLDALQDNGGDTETHALLAGSPAIDAGDNVNCPATDQRGAPRPVDGESDSNAVCDMGAYEFDGAAPTGVPTLTPVPTVTPTATPQFTFTPTPTPTASATVTMTATPTATATTCSISTQIPAPLAPTNHAQLNTTRVKLQWNSVTCATHYQVVARQDSKKGARILNQGVSVTSAILRNLSRAHDYYWRVRACGAAGCGVWTKWWNFKISP